MGQRAGARLVAVPDGDGRLSEGLLVEGRLVARLVGLRLLTVDARLVLTPAQLAAPPALGCTPAGASSGGRAARGA